MLDRPSVEVFIAVSLDGFIARPGGELDWLMQAQATAPEGEDFGYAGFMASVDFVVMGRHTLETVVGFEPWPYSQPVLAMTRAPQRPVPEKLRNRIQWSNETPAALLQRLGQEGHQRVYLDGGQLIQSFLREQLVDRLTLTVIPCLIGQGRPLWGPLDVDQSWDLEGVQHWPNGFVQMRYRRAQDGATT